MKNDPAFPFSPNQPKNSDDFDHRGLTKLEYFACCALKAIASRSYDHVPNKTEAMVNDALVLANALIKKLEEPTRSGITNPKGS